MSTARFSDAKKIAVAVNEQQTKRAGGSVISTGKGVDNFLPPTAAPGRRELVDDSAANATQPFASPPSGVVP